MVNPSATVAKFGFKCVISNWKVCMATAQLKQG